MTKDDHPTPDPDTFGNRAREWVQTYLSAHAERELAILDAHIAIRDPDSHAAREMIKAREAINDAAEQRRRFAAAREPLKQTRMIKMRDGRIVPAKARIGYAGVVLDLGRNFHRLPVYDDEGTREAAPRLFPDKSVPELCSIIAGLAYRIEEDGAADHAMFAFASAFRALSDAAGDRYFIVHAFRPNGSMIASSYERLEASSPEDAEAQMDAVADAMDGEAYQTYEDVAPDGEAA